jgi:hypothetical protein
MRLSFSVNENSVCIASLPRPGYLSAHVNLHDLPNDHSTKARIQGTETAEKPRSFRERL